VFSGRHVVIGRLDDLWRRGVNMSEQLSLYKEFIVSGNTAKKMMESGIHYLCEFKAKPVVLWNRSQWGFFEVIDQNDKCTEIVL
jgi:hypothetical protein